MDEDYDPDYDCDTLAKLAIQDAGDWSEEVPPPPTPIYDAVSMRLDLDFPF